MYIHHLKYTVCIRLNVPVYVCSVLRSFLSSKKRQGLRAHSSKVRQQTLLGQNALETSNALIRELPVTPSPVYCLFGRHYVCSRLLPIPLFSQTNNCMKFANIFKGYPVHVDGMARTDSGRIKRHSVCDVGISTQLSKNKGIDKGIEVSLSRCRLITSLNTTDHSILDSRGHSFFNLVMTH